MVAGSKILSHKVPFLGSYFKWCNGALLDWGIQFIGLDSEVIRLLHVRCFVVGKHLFFSKHPANTIISAFALGRCPACSHCLTFKPSSSIIIIYFLVVFEDCSQESSIDFVFVMSDSNFIWGLLWLDGIKSQKEYDKLKGLLLIFYVTFQTLYFCLEEDRFLKYKRIYSLRHL